MITGKELIMVLPMNVFTRQGTVRILFTLLLLPVRMGFSGNCLRLLAGMARSESNDCCHQGEQDHDLFYHYQFDYTNEIVGFDLAKIESC